jgi:hypothetical protein
VEAQNLHLLPTGQAQASGTALLESRNGQQLRVQTQHMGRARICVARGTSHRYGPC